MTELQHKTTEAGASDRKSCNSLMDGAEILLQNIENRYDDPGISCTDIVEVEKSVLRHLLMQLI